MGINEQVSAVKARVKLIANPVNAADNIGIKGVADLVQTAGIATTGQILVDGSGNITVGGVALSTNQYIAIGEVLGLTIS